MMSSNTPLLLLITGSRGSGKTTFCQTMIQSAREAGWQVSGLITHPIFTGQTRTALQAEDLRTGQTTTLATRSEQPTPGTQHWKFDDAAIDWGNTILQSATPTDLLVIDELGPIELERGEGWQAAFGAIASKQYAIAIVVVRADLLGEALMRWGEANLVEIDTLEDSQRKAQTIAQQLF